MLRNIIPILLLSFFSPYAYASDYTGFIATMYLIIVITLSTAINIGLIISFHVSYRYESINFTKTHIGFALIFPVIGVFLTLSDYKTTEDLLFILGFNGLAAAIAISPIFIRKVPFKDKGKVGFNMLILSSFFGALAVIFFAPASVLSIIAGHIAINENQNTLRTCSIGVVGFSYIFMLYWLYTLIALLS